MDMYARVREHEAWLRRLEEEIHELRAEIRRDEEHRTRTEEVYGEDS